MAVARRRLPAEETRAQILEVAERLFAERGFAETRLEDVAGRVGVKRQALFYYFRDKRALYEEIVGNVFGGLFGQLQDALEAPGASLQEALEDALSRFVEYVWARPSTAHILLSEATRRENHSEAFRSLARPALDCLRQVFDEGHRRGVFRPITTDPLHFASFVAGSTVFFVGAVPSLVPELPFDPLSREQLAIHKRDLIRVTRRLLGLSSLRPA